MQEVKVFLYFASPRLAHPSRHVMEGSRVAGVSFDDKDGLSHIDSRSDSKYGTTFSYASDNPR